MLPPATKRRVLLATLALTLVLASPLDSRVVRVEILSREDVLDGRPFGEAGAYEKITGRIHFAFDPEDPANARIADLEHAPRNERGLVEAWADFVALRPVDPSRGSGVALLEVSNRGGKAALGYLNDGGFALDPSEPEHFGDGLLMRRGHTVLWVGWQWDVPEREGLLRLHVPVARHDTGPLTGLVRADWVVDEPTTTLPLGHRAHRAYPVSDTLSPEIRLTVRDGREAPRRTVPRSEWGFGRETEGGGVEPSRVHIHRPGGFEPGRIYELVYPAEDPRVVGLGLAAIRDAISFAKHGPEAPFPARHGIALGISQTGRFLRHFLYQGFNTDEEGRKALDGMMIHTAGAGRGSFNHRFAQPSRDAHRFSAFFYPTDLFPFSGRVQRDTLTGRRDGLLAHTPEEHLPRVFYTNTGYEYWGRAGSLLHTSLDAGADVEPLPQERLYHLAGTQHFVDGLPPRPETRLTEEGEPAAYRGNPADLLVHLRALLDRMAAWVRDGEPPPESRYPRIDQGTLGTLADARAAFPSIPGLEVPEVVHVAYRADYGRRFAGEGIVERQPPDLGLPFPSLVPLTDSLGNELGGLRVVELRAPLATYTPWSLRTGLPGPAEELADFRGTFVPLPWTEAERRRTGDPRPAVEALYPSREAYLDRVRVEAEGLVREGFLLEEDVGRVVERMAVTWDWMAERSEASPAR